GVRAAGVTTVLPLGGGAWTNIYGLPGDAPDEWSRNEASFRMATPGYFAALGIPLLSGRPFTRADDTERRRVVVVDQAMAVRLAGAGQDPGSVVGRRLAFPLDGRPVEAEIVGVVGSVRDPTLFARGRPTFYVPYRHEASRTVAIAVRGTGDPALLAPAVRRAVEEVDPHLPLQRVRTLSSYLREQSAPVRFALLLMGAFAGSAILLSGVGLYGSVSQALVSRRRELGVRMALGAQPERLVADAVREGMRSALAGIAIGLLLAAPFALVVRRLVYGVAPADPLAWSGAGVTLALVALVACWLSAHAITRLEVTEALRSD
ncbi:MAG TPA: ABC transporter permease, partial [Candidatus Thermoplasmatota archaeon]